MDDRTGGVPACLRAAVALELDIIGILPFSDRGIVLGALPANAEGLPGCDLHRSTQGWAR